MKTSKSPAGSYASLTVLKKQKEFFRSSEGFVRATLIGHGNPGPLSKIAQMALFNPCMKFEFYGGQMPSFEVL